MGRKAPQGAVRTRKKRTNVCKVACTQCVAYKKKCDEQRPCSRCVKLGLECIDRVFEPAASRGREEFLDADDGDGSSFDDEGGVATLAAVAAGEAAAIGGEGGGAAVGDDAGGMDMISLFTLQIQMQDALRQMFDGPAADAGRRVGNLDAWSVKCAFSNQSGIADGDLRILLPKVDSGYIVMAVMQAVQRGEGFVSIPARCCRPQQPLLPGTILVRVELNRPLMMQQQQQPPQSAPQQQMEGGGGGGSAQSSPMSPIDSASYMGGGAAPAPMLQIPIWPMSTAADGSNGWNPVMMMPVQPNAATVAPNSGAIPMTGMFAAPGMVGMVAAPGLIAATPAATSFDLYAQQQQLFQQQFQMQQQQQQEAVAGMAAVAAMMAGRLNSGGSTSSSGASSASGSAAGGSASQSARSSGGAPGLMMPAAAAALPGSPNYQMLQPQFFQPQFAFANPAAAAMPFGPFPGIARIASPSIAENVQMHDWRTDVWRRDSVESLCSRRLSSESDPLFRRESKESVPWRRDSRESFFSRQSNDRRDSRESVSMLHSARLRGDSHDLPAVVPVHDSLMSDDEQSDAGSDEEIKLSDGKAVNPPALTDIDANMFQ